MVNEGFLGFSSIPPNFSLQIWQHFKSILQKTPFIAQQTWKTQCNQFWTTLTHNRAIFVHIFNMKDRWEVWYIILNKNHMKKSIVFCCSIFCHCYKKSEEDSQIGKLCSSLFNWYFLILLLKLFNATQNFPQNSWHLWDTILNMNICKFES